MKNSVDEQYIALLEKILVTGSVKGDRTGTGTKSRFGTRLEFNLQDGFPLLTTKKVHLKSIIHELLWFLNGDTNTKYLKDNGVTIWDEWADENGDLGPIYSAMWRSWPNPDGSCVDQIQELITTLKSNPNSRRHIVCAWNPSVMPDTSKSFGENVANGKAALPPCHALFQFDVTDGKLSCQLYQRSCDVFLGVPFNIASYSLLTMMVAQVCDLELGNFIWVGGDTHIYLNHKKQAELQMSREPFGIPTMEINPEVKNIFNFKYEDFELKDYNCHPAIKAPISK